MNGKPQDQPDLEALNTGKEDSGIYQHKASEHNKTKKLYIR